MVRGDLVDAAEVPKREIVGIRAFWDWGLHWTPGGWLYNVGGRDAVRLMLAREKPVIVGTDDAPGPAAAIGERIPGERIAGAARPNATTSMST